MLKTKQTQKEHNQMQELINKNQEYLQYIQNHYNNVQKAWKILQQVSPEYLQNEWVYTTVNNDIKHHDESKMSEEEFQPYRNKFYPCANEPLNQPAYDKAWEHHLANNSHTGKPGPKCQNHTKNQPFST